MSGSAQQPPEPQLTTTRIGGGRSPRLAAGAVLLVLGAFVYLGLSGPNQPPPPPSAAPPRASLAAIADESPDAVTETVHQVRATEDPVVFGSLGSVLEIEGIPYPGVLEQINHGSLFEGVLRHHRAVYFIPTSVAAQTATLRIGVFVSSIDPAGGSVIGEWPLSLDVELMPGRTTRVLNITKDGAPEAINAPEIDRNGYLLAVDIKPDVGGRVLLINLYEGWSHWGFGPIQSDYLAGIKMGDGFQGEPLAKQSEGNYFGRVTFRAADVGRKVTIALATESPPLGALQVLDTWRVSLNPVRRAVPGQSVELLSASGRLGLEDAAPSFRIWVIAWRQAGEIELTFQLQEVFQF